MSTSRKVRSGGSPNLHPGHPPLNNAGQPRPDLFAKDDLHLIPKGYALWRNTIRPILVHQERIYENE